VNSNSIYKLAFAQYPAVAVASAAAAVGLPGCFTKLAVSPFIAKRLMSGTLKDLARARSGVPHAATRRMERGTLERMASKRPWMRGVKGYRQPSRPPPLPQQRSDVPMLGPDQFSEVPGLGRRVAQGVAKNWWTLPVAGAGVYGLGHTLSQATGAGAEPQQMGYGYPAVAQTPAQDRYTQMMALARQYGY